ncbi:MAG TPA: DUF3093 domain-containing protein [Microbacterium sp.]|uniref:DUF3093 domain-containing protein n=1 Tax=Microbacterium sp. TaxID=51671 RepID=UPI002BCC1EA5|nr:DUF3093 domain-containing protein [Microbacterium sp.]HWI31933.1 DUF3093 domain-containing protein [Microbacterium sp.]
MQNTQHDIQSPALYRERLTPSLWAIVAAAVVAPMAALVFAPIDSTLALVAGAIVGVAVVTLLIVISPLVEVRDGMLRAGRARIDVACLGRPVARTAQSAREARGPGLDPRGWHLIRGGIDGVIVVDVNDPDDPTPTWTVSSRTPDRLAAAIVRAQATRRTPCRSDPTSSRGPAANGA